MPDFRLFLPEIHPQGKKENGFAEACLRLTDRQFLSIGASYETKDKFRSVNVGYGVFF